MDYIVIKRRLSEQPLNSIHDWKEKEQASQGKRNEETVIFNYQHESLMVLTKRRGDHGAGFTD
ncbi:hypothetical protein ABE504_17880 [Paenibacillus oryzisoli]|uniref:hypothetical protein n=1 Tax=Paenibacillus oryzisoli TaxID=1850517 RepID=UPI003D2D1EF1